MVRITTQNMSQGQVMNVNIDECVRSTRVYVNRTKSKAGQE